MADRDREWLDSLYADLCAGAQAEGAPAPRREDVARLGALLRAGDAAPPSDLVPALHAALVAAAQPRLAPRVAPSPRSLLGLLWAEARYLPLPFFALQVGLLALALVANRYLTGFAGTAPAGQALWRDALGRSRDAFTLVAPCLGLAVAFWAALPGRRGTWADLEALSPFSGPTRLLARAAVAALAAWLGTAAAGLLQLGPSAAPLPAALLLLARSAPLFLAVAWALAWAVPCGAAGAAAASLALWGALAAAAGRLGAWDLFAPPGAAAPAQALAIAASLVLLAVAWALSRRAASRALPA